MTDAERVAKVPWQRRLQIYALFRKGQFRTHIAAQLGLTKTTVNAVIEAMEHRQQQIERQKHAPDPVELWQSAITPGWRVHGEVGKFARR